MQISRSVFGDRLDRWTNTCCARCTTRRAHAASRACAHDDGKAEVAEVGGGGAAVMQCSSGLV